MITAFDVWLTLGVLAATFLSNMPKKGAILLCLVCLSVMVAADYLTGGWTFYFLSVFIEFSAMLLLLVAARMLPERQDRLFFRLMAGMFLASQAVTGAFILIDPMPHKLYAALSHGIAVVHVLVMLSFSDGIRNFTQDAGSRLLGTWRGLVH